MRFELGAKYLGDGRCQFVVWGPIAESMDLCLLRLDGSRTSLPMQLGEHGYYHLVASGVKPGTLYFYRVNGQKELPDPASRFQPRGVHGPSQVSDSHYDWKDHSWFGLPLQRYVIYELHVGTFTPEGALDAIIPYLKELKELGITALELMPLAQFPGNRNWGYDGVYPFAVQDSYGGPEALKRLVEACHQHGLAVLLDVVYNHLGPEGNYLSQFGPYFTKRYRTPWGEALNFDGAHSDEVRRFFIDNALYWITEFHFDALRLDAVHAIFDHTAYPFLQELADAVHRRANQLNRQIYVIAESSLNDARLIRPAELGGLNMDAQWNDDFHHALHTLLTGEQTGYYQDFGGLDDLAKSLAEGYVYTGQYSAFRRRRHGSSSQQIPAHRFVVCAQNHDQVGNRRLSERLSQLVSFEALKLAAGAVLLSANLPLLFMGEEYGETAPFRYFISHSDPELIEAVRRGRRQEFSAFEWQGETSDPQAPETFERSKLHRSLREKPQNRALFEFYKQLLQIRRNTTALAQLSKPHLEVTAFKKEKVLCLRRWSDTHEVFSVFHFGETPTSLTLLVPPGLWRKLLDSSDKRWLGDGSAIPEELESAGELAFTVAPKSFALFSKIGNSSA